MYCKSLVFAKQKHTLGINWWGRSCSWYTGHIFTPVWRYHFLKTKISHLLPLITISPHLSIQYTNRYTDGKYVKGNATTTVAVEDRWGRRLQYWPLRLYDPYNDNRCGTGAACIYEPGQEGCWLINLCPAIKHNMMVGIPIDLGIF